MEYEDMVTQDYVDNLEVMNQKYKSTIKVLIFVMICQATAIILMALTMSSF